MRFCVGVVILGFDEPAANFDGVQLVAADAPREDLLLALRRVEVPLAVLFDDRNRQRPAILAGQKRLGSFDCRGSAPSSSSGRRARQRHAGLSGRQRDRQLSRCSLPKVRESRSSLRRHRFSRRRRAPAPRRRQTGILCRPESRQRRGLAAGTAPAAANTSTLKRCISICSCIFSRLICGVHRPGLRHRPELHRRRGTATAAAGKAPVTVHLDAAALTHTSEGSVIASTGRQTPISDVIGAALSEAADAVGAALGGHAASWAYRGFSLAHTGRTTSGIARTNPAGSALRGYSSATAGSSLTWLARSGQTLLAGATLVRDC